MLHSPLERDYGPYGPRGENHSLAPIRGAIEDGDFRWFGYPPVGADYAHGEIAKHFPDTKFPDPSEELWFNASAAPEEAPPEPWSIDDWEEMKREWGDRDDGEGWPTPRPFTPEPFGRDHRYNPHKSAAQSELGWEPGQPGKGWVLEDGSLWTWNVDEERRPYHMHKNKQMQAMGLQPMKVSDPYYGFMIGAFQIDPDGAVHRLGDPLPAPLVEAITAADPRLSAGDDTAPGWNFA
jgi:hypothetical protein